jgi:hypothetical protein
MISGGWRLRYWCTLPGVTPDTERPFTPDQMGAARPRRRTGLFIGATAGAVALVAASVAITLSITDGSKPGPAAQQTPSSPATSAAAVAPPASTALPPTAAPTTAALKFGAKANNTARGSTATAYAYKQPVAANATPPEQEGYEWGAADVEVCPSTTNVVVRDSWRLVYADNTTINPSSTGYRQFPQPEYPWDEREVAGGRCVRGWIVYPTPAGKKPMYVEYGPQGFIADWAVS